MLNLAAPLSLCNSQGPRHYEQIIVTGYNQLYLAMITEGMPHQRTPWNKEIH